MCLCMHVFMIYDMKEGGFIWEENDKHKEEQEIIMDGIIKSNK